MGLSDGRLQARERGTARLNQVETKCSHCKGICKIWCRKKIHLNLCQVAKEVWKISEPNHFFHYTRRNKKHLEELPELGRIEGRSNKQWQLCQVWLLSWAEQNGENRAVYRVIREGGWQSKGKSVGALKKKLNSLLRTLTRESDSWSQDKSWLILTPSGKWPRLQPFKI